jgi:steroid delta-isomerase-like uncharacterized protein
MGKPILLLVFCYCLAAPGRGQSRHRHEGVAKRYLIEVVNNRKLEVLNQLFADTFVVHVLTKGTAAPVTVATQREFLIYFFHAFPDLHYTLEEVMSDGNKVMLRTSFSGTHQGEFMGYAASGKRIPYMSEIFIYRFEKGKIKESWVQYDLYALEHALTTK